MVDRTGFSKERRKGTSDRRNNRVPAGGPMGDRRTKFSLWYFVVAFLALIAIQYFVGRQGSEQIAYSELKNRIAAGQVESVSLSASTMEAVPVDSLTERTGVRLWTAVRVEDDTLVPLLEQRNIPYEGTLQGWFSQALGWLLPIAVMLAFWFWILRRMN